MLEVAERRGPVDVARGPGRQAGAERKPDPPLALGPDPLDQADDRGECQDSVVDPLVDEHVDRSLPDPGEPDRVQRYAGERQREQRPEDGLQMSVCSHAIDPCFLIVSACLELEPRRSVRPLRRAGSRRARRRRRPRSTAPASDRRRPRRPRAAPARDARSRRRSLAARRRRGALRAPPSSASC